MIDLIKELSLLNATSGDETEAIALISKKLPKDCTFKVDNLGNIIVQKKGKAIPKNKLMIAAHMDEVGFIITDIGKDGTLGFDAVGGIMPEVVIGRQVQFKSGLIGVIGAKPIHLLEKEEEKVQPKIVKLLIDIGANDKADAEKHVHRGDNCYFVSEFFQFGNAQIKGKALDDRVGCAIMLELINSELPYDCTFAFTVQEEIGTRGAAVAAYSVNPDIAVVLETTTACDIPAATGAKRVCELGKGTVISFMDRGTMYDKALYKLASETADEKDIKWQTKSLIAGGNDSAAIHKAAGGIRTVALSLPCRYLHSPACVINITDLTATRELISVLLPRLANI